MSTVLQGLEGMIADWVRRTFGEKSLMDTKNRAARVVEEAVELAQTEGIEPHVLHNIIARAYSRPVGDKPQEVAGTLFTLLAYGYAAGIDCVEVCKEEVRRVNTLPAEKFRAKQREKFELGTDFAAPVE